MSEDTKTVYACRRHAGFFFEAGGKIFRFEKHQLTVTDPAEIAAIDEVCAKYPGIGNKVEKVSIDAAEALVRKHIASHGGAVQGMFTSNEMNASNLNLLNQRDAKLSAMTPQQEAAIRDSLAKDSELLTTARTVAQKTEAKVVLATEVAKPAPKLTIGK